MGVSNKKTTTGSETATNQNTNEAFNTLTNQNTNQNTTQTGLGTTNLTSNGSTTATNPAWVTDAIQGLVGQIGGLSNPGQYVPGASGLQQQAFQQAGGLTTSGLFGSAANLVNGALGQGTPQATAAQLGPTAMVGGPTLGPAAQAEATSFGGSTIAPVQRIGASSLLEGLDNYVNPLLQNVVDTTLTGYDKSAAQQQAQLSAAGARNGAFGGSRFGLAEGQLGADLVDNRAATEAGLRSDAYNSAYGFSGQDADRRQSAASTNATLAAQHAEAQARLEQAAAQANAEAQNQKSQFNASQTNQQSQLLAQLMQAAGITNAGATNNANATQAGFNQQTNLANQNAGLQGIQNSLTGAGLLGSLGTAQDTSNRGNIGLLGDLGSQQHALDTEQAQAPLSLLQLQQSLLGGLPLNLFNGQNTTNAQTGVTTDLQNGNVTGSTTGTTSGTSTGNTTATGTTNGYTNQNGGLGSLLGGLSPLFGGLSDLGWKPFG